MNRSEKINYLEYPAKDLAATKKFFEQVFQWEFTDYGPEYISFSKTAGVEGGFYQSPLYSSPANGAALTVFYATNIANIQSQIKAAGGNIVKSIFAFPGGVRFHFTDPNGNEFAVWSEQV